MYFLNPRVIVMNKLYNDGEIYDYCAWAIKKQLFGMALKIFTIFKIPRVLHFCHSLHTLHMFKEIFQIHKKI